jgi:hypothetical protein
LDAQKLGHGRNYKTPEVKKTFSPSPAHDRHGRGRRVAVLQDHHRQPLLRQMGALKLYNLGETSLEKDPLLSLRHHAEEKATV